MGRTQVILRVKEKGERAATQKWEFKLRLEKKRLLSMKLLDIENVDVESMVTVEEKSRRNKI